MYSSTIGTMLTAASFSTIAAAKPSWSSWAESPLFSSEPCFGDRCGIPSVKRNLAPVIFWNSRYASFPQKATNRWRRVSSATARPERPSKQRYFTDYLKVSSRPEDWIEQSLGSFNYWNQSELTLPFLKPALEALPQIKRERKIFFLLGWLNAFIGGQQSAEAQAQVHAFLRTETLDKDLQLKILEVSDELDRTVKIRQRYP